MYSEQQLAAKLPSGPIVLELPQILAKLLLYEVSTDVLYVINGLEIASCYKLFRDIQQLVSV